MHCVPTSIIVHCIVLQIGRSSFVMVISFVTFYGCQIVSCFSNPFRRSSLLFVVCLAFVVSPCSAPHSPVVSYSFGTIQ